MSLKFHSAFLVLLSILILFSCDPEEIVNPIIEEKPFEKYIGSHNIDLLHISGLHEQYDSIGNPLGLVYDTSFHENQQINIDQLDLTDSLILENLITGYPFYSEDVKGVVNEDTLMLYRELGDLQNRDYIRGYIFKSVDSIYINYKWDKTEIWSGYAPPYYGMITGKAKL